jgi:hypothetical protein
MTARHFKIEALTHYDLYEHLRYRCLSVTALVLVRERSALCGYAVIEISCLSSHMFPRHLLQTTKFDSL